MTQRSDTTFKAVLVICWLAGAQPGTANAQGDLDDDKTDTPHAELKTSLLVTPILSASSTTSSAATAEGGIRLRTDTWSYVKTSDGRSRVPGGALVGRLTLGTEISKGTTDLVTLEQGEAADLAPIDVNVSLGHLWMPWDTKRDIDKLLGVDLTLKMEAVDHCILICTANPTDDGCKDFENERSTIRKKSDPKIAADQWSDEASKRVSYDDLCDDGKVVYMKAREKLKKEIPVYDVAPPGGLFLGASFDTQEFEFVRTNPTYPDYLKKTETTKTDWEAGLSGYIVFERKTDERSDSMPNLRRHRPVLEARFGAGMDWDDNDETATWCDDESLGLVPTDDDPDSTDPTPDGWAAHECDSATYGDPERSFKMTVELGAGVVEFGSARWRLAGDATLNWDFGNQNTMDTVEFALRLLYNVAALGKGLRKTQRPKYSGIVVLMPKLIIDLEDNDDDETSLAFVFTMGFLGDRTLMPESYKAL